MSRRTLTTEEFINKANHVHNNGYRYPGKYINSKTKISIECEAHGIFYQKPGDHLQGQGCLKCKIDKQRLASGEVIKRSRNAHGNKYDYPGPYKDTMSKMPIICSEHGTFYQNVNVHLSGSGCPMCCSPNQRSSMSSFIKRAHKIHGNEYQYYGSYLNARTKISISCKIHGIFYQTPDNHLHGQGCPKCSSFTFDFKKPAVVYLIELKNCVEHFIKIGISNNHLRRFCEIKSKYSIVNKLIFPFSTGQQAHNIENLLLDYNLKKYVPQDDSFKGKTECFELSEQKFINNFIKTQSAVV